MECALLCSPQHTILGKEGCLREVKLLLDVLYQPDPRLINSKPTRASRSENAFVGGSTTMVFLSVHDKCSQVYRESQQRRKTQSNKHSPPELLHT